ncbi:MAG: hypothetical protein NVS3B16_24760 [Vulcanimicrobiaceae bacterium]
MNGIHVVNLFDHASERLAIDSGLPLFQARQRVMNADAAPAGPLFSAVPSGTSRTAPVDDAAPILDTLDRDDDERTHYDDDATDDSGRDDIDRDDAEGAEDRSGWNGASYGSSNY